MDKLKNIWRWIKHNPWVCSVMLLLLLLLFWAFGCEPKAQSPSGTGQRITRSELKIEIAAFVSRAEQADVVLAKQEKLRKLLLEQGLILAHGGVINWYSLATSAMSILGVGAVLDNRRKDGKIKIQKENIKQLANYVGPSG